MNWITQAAISMGVGILKMALPMITDGLKELMKDSVKKWKAYALQTPYDWDNLVVKALETLLGLDEEPCETTAGGSNLHGGSATVEVTGPVVSP